MPQSAVLEVLDEAEKQRLWLHLNDYFASLFNGDTTVFQLENQSEVYVLFLAISMMGPGKAEDFLSVSRASMNRNLARYLTDRAIGLHQGPLNGSVMGSGANCHLRQAYDAFITVLTEAVRTGRTRCFGERTFFGSLFLPAWFVDKFVEAP